MAVYTKPLPFLLVWAKRFPLLLIVWASYLLFSQKAMLAGAAAPVVLFAFRALTIYCLVEVLWQLPGMDMNQVVHFGLIHLHRAGCPRILCRFLDVTFGTMSNAVVSSGLVASLLTSSAPLILPTPSTLLICTAILLLERMTFVQVDQVLPYYFTGVAERLADSLLYAAVPIFWPVSFILDGQTTLAVWCVCFRWFLAHMDPYVILALNSSRWNPVQFLLKQFAKLRYFVTVWTLKTVTVSAANATETFGRFPARRLSSKPDLLLVCNTLSVDVCRQLAAEVESSPTVPSPWIHYLSHYEDLNRVEGWPSLNKTSEAYPMPAKVKDVLFPLLEELTGLPQGNYETKRFAIMKYRPGSALEVHSDGVAALPRVCTAIFCFREADVGGETAFPRLGIKIKLSPGDVLIFRYPPGDPDNELLLHSGAAVLQGTKLILNQFIRAVPFVDM
jgi:alkylated DNA repair dioxygenase AlkB